MRTPIGTLLRTVPLAVITFFAVAALSPEPMRADAVVGTGTPEGCTEQALDAALAEGGNIRFNCGNSPVTIVLTNPKILLDTDEIDINGGGLVTLSGGAATELFINTGRLGLSDLTVANGRASMRFGAGGAIANAGTLTVFNCTFRDNSTPAFGGAILNDGTLNIARSTFLNNVAPIGGAICNSGNLRITGSTFAGNESPDASASGGAIDNGGTLQVSNSTFAGNGFMGGGGAIVTWQGTYVTVINSTFWGNSLGAISNYGALTVTITNSILDKSNWSNCIDAVMDGGHNLDSDGTCGVGPATDPMLDPAGLADNGGPTQTIALQAGSPAINAGDETICAAPPVNGLDERGFVRPGNGSVNCSIGAYEYNSTPASTPTETPQATPTPTATALATSVPCLDCGGDGQVTVDDLITIINIALGNLPPSACGFAADPFNVTSLVTAVDEALNGCPMPVPTATPTLSITYQLGQGSTITYAAPIPGASPIVEALSGAFVTVVLPPPYCCNVRFALAVTSFDFESLHFSVTGTAGGISATTVSPSVNMSLTGTINGQPFENMTGGESFPVRDPHPFPPVLNDMVICEAVPLGQSVSCEDIRNGVGSGYTLTIFATPQSLTAPSPGA